MKIINLVGVFLISSFSTPYALKDTPNNLIIEKKEANITELSNDNLCLPLWSVFNPDRDFIYSANIIFSGFQLDYDTVGNSFDEVIVNSFRFTTSLEILTIDYDNTVEIQYSQTIETRRDINQTIIFNEDYGELIFGGSLELSNTGSSTGLGPNYQGQVYLAYLNNHEISLLWSSATEPIYNIYIYFITWLQQNINQVKIDTGLDNVLTGYTLNYQTNITLIDYSEYKTFYDFGYSIGDTEGYGRGTIDGYNTGYEQGYNVGESNGYSMGFDIGYESGYTDGNEGKGDFDFVWLTTLFSSLNTILSVEILNGFKLWYLFAVPLVVALIVGVMKLLR